MTWSSIYTLWSSFKNGFLLSLSAIGYHGYSGESVMYLSTNHYTHSLIGKKLKNEFDDLVDTTKWYRQINPRCAWRIWLRRKLIWWWLRVMYGIMNYATVTRKTRIWLQAVGYKINFPKIQNFAISPRIQISTIAYIYVFPNDQQQSIPTITSTSI